MLIKRRNKSDVVQEKGISDTPSVNQTIAIQRRKTMSTNTKSSKAKNDTWLSGE